MPIDANIPLSVAPLGIEDPATMQAKAAQAQLARQKVQGGAIELQQQRQAASQSDQIRGIFQNAPDLRTALPDVMKVNPALGLSMQKSMHDQEKAALDAQEQQIKMNGQKAAALGNIAGTINDDVSFHNGISQALQQGVIDNGHAQALLTQGWNPQTAQQVKQLAASTMTVQQQQEEALKKVQDERAALKSQHEAELFPAEKQMKEAGAVTASLGSTAQQLAAETDPARYEQIRTASPVAGSFPPAAAVFGPDGKLKPDMQDAIGRIGMTVDQRAKADQEPKQVPGRDIPFSAAVEQQHTRMALAGRPVNNFMAKIPGMDNLFAQNQGEAKSGEEFLKGIPAGFANGIRSIAAGDQKPPSASDRSPFAMQTWLALNQYEPGFNSQRWMLRNQFAKDNVLGNLNTAAVHADTLSEVAKAMGNGSFRPGNDLWNRAATMFGGTPPTNFAALREAVAGELDKGLHGTSTIPGREAIEATLPASGSGDQLAQAIDTHIGTIAQKMQTYRERYQQISGGDTRYDPITPSAAAAIARHQKGGGGATDQKLKAYADAYFGGDLKKAQAEIDKQRGK
jgi:hypothetical protein